LTQPEVTTKPISELHAAPYNPRQITDAAWKGLAASIERFGLVQPVVWNKRTGHVVGGHQRLYVLEQRGVTNVSVVVVDLPESEEKALNLTLNNPHVAGEFTVEAITLLEELDAEDGDVLDTLQLTSLLTELQEAAGQGDGTGEDVAEPPDGFPAVDDDLATDYKCPKCGFEWSGKPRCL